MIKQFLKKITGIQLIEDAKLKARAEAENSIKIAEEAAAAAKAALESVERANKEAEIAKLTPKDRATAMGEPWVSVLDTHVNKDNVRNGFFELDWNEHFIVQLKEAGYGFDGDPDEQIVDRWFRDLAGNMLAEAGQDVSRVGGGFINVNKLPGGKAEVE